MAIQDAQSNGYVASLTDKPEAKMGMLHAAYGKMRSLIVACLEC